MQSEQVVPADNYLRDAYRHPRQNSRMNDFYNGVRAAELEEEKNRPNFDNRAYASPTSYTPQDVEDDSIGQKVLLVGDTYPERKLKPSQVPLFPEETIKRQ